MAGWRQRVLLKFSENKKDAWTVDDAIKGTAIIGATGAGKTTSSGKTIAMQFLKEGWGGIVLCAKPDEADLWLQYCDDAGRSDDVIVFGKNSVHQSGDYEGQKIVFNPLDYEMNRDGDGAGETFNITNIFMNLYRMGNRISNEDTPKDERFWDSALKRMLNRSIDMIKIAGEELSYDNLIALINSCPKESNPFNEDKWERDYAESTDIDNDPDLQESYFLKCLTKVYQEIENEQEGTALFNAAYSAYTYFTRTFPELSERTQSTVIESFMGLAEPFINGLLFEHFSGKTNLFPEQTFTEYKIIILDFPVKEYLEAGVMAQSVFKLIFQQAVERRRDGEYPMPVFLWADEAHYFVTPYDQIFLTTARSSRAATVFLSQNIPNYLAAIGTQDAKSRVDSLMGNLNTKIFHANSDTMTNKYSSEMIGQAVSFMSSRGSSSTLFSMNFSSSRDLRSDYRPQVQPREFTTLRSGGDGNNLEVDAIVFVTGRKWSTGNNFIRTIFEQKFSNK